MELRPASLSVCCTSDLANFNAGANPDANPARQEMPNVNASTDESMLTSSRRGIVPGFMSFKIRIPNAARSEEHTSELQSPLQLGCRLLLEKKKNHEPVPASRLPDD